MATAGPLTSTLVGGASVAAPLSPSYSPAGSPVEESCQDEVPSIDEDDSSEGEPMDARPFRGEVQVDALTKAPWDFKMSPAHIESVATAPIITGDLPSVEMRRLDVGQRSAVGELQMAVRNLADLSQAAAAVGSAPAPSLRKARHERKLLERRVRSSALRLWKLIRREDSRWTDLALASSSSVDRQRLMFGALRAQESQLTSRQ